MSMKRIVQLYFVTLLILCPAFVLAFQVTAISPANNSIGIDPATTITITFDNPLYDVTNNAAKWPGNPEEYVTIIEVTDYLGRPSNTAISVSWGDMSTPSNGADQKLIISPPSSTLQKGCIFRVTVLTTIVNTSSQPLSAQFTSTFSTAFDKNTGNLFYCADGISKIEIPFETLLSDGFLKIINTPTTDTIITTPVSIAAAKQSARTPLDPLRFVLESTMREFDLYYGTALSSSPVRDTALVPNRAGDLPLITLTYDDTDNDGKIVDGVNPVVLESSLSMWWLDIQTNNWEKLASSVDALNNTVSAATNKLTVFVLMGAVFQDLNQARAYPVPFKPNSNRTHTHITFSRLQPNSIVRIYTIAGELVKELSTDVYGSDIPWDTTNDTGAKAVSGLYIYRITAGGHHTSGKLVIIR
jgi:hypothetical protein